MMRILTLLIGTGMLLGHGQAQERVRQRDSVPAPAEYLGQAEEAVSFAFADVLSAEPVYEVVESTRPREQCFERRGERYNDSTTGTIVGAIIGGAAGSRVGDGNGRRAATVAGAVIGGLVGREVDANNGPVRNGGSRTECETVNEIVEEQQIAGYDVQYRYRGEVYLSRLSYDPGSKLRIRVAISPADP